MKILHISDHSLELPYPTIADSPENIITAVKEQHVDTELFLVNVHYQAHGICQTDNAGIQFVKLLRLHQNRKHCVLYSFISREKLLDLDPRNLILFSKGITVVDTHTNLSTIDYDLLAQQKAPVDLSPFFKAEFNLPDDRHFFANWWGVLQLWKVQKAVENIAGITAASDFETELSGSIREMNSYNGLLARYLKGVSEKEIEAALKSLISKKKDYFEEYDKNRYQIQKELDELQVNDNELDIQIATLMDILKEESNSFLTKLFSFFTSLPNSVKTKIEKLDKHKDKLKNKILKHEEYLELLSAIEKEKEHAYETRRSLNRQIKARIKTLAVSKPFISKDYSVEKLRNELNTKKPSIVFADDQARDGWGAILQRIIYGGFCEKFHIVEPLISQSSEEIAQTIIDTIIAVKADLLILDLRLKGEKGNIPTHEISGIRVLELLVKNKPTCPILITTASNKLWTYKETTSLGADAYWIKQGLDDSADIEPCVENYLRLIDLVYVLCFSEEYRFVYKKLLPSFLHIQRAETTFWWETKFWNDDVLYEVNTSGLKEKKRVSKTKPIAREDVLESLLSSLDLLKKLLSDKMEKYDSFASMGHTASLVILMLGRTLEVIHGLDVKNNQVHLSNKMQNQLGKNKYDYFSKLLTIRNKAAHEFVADFSYIKNFVDLLLEYLMDTILDTPLSDLKNHEDTPNETVLFEPANGEYYNSEIISVHSNGYKFYLKNPNLNLQVGLTNIILNSNYNRHVDPKKLIVGAKIKFKLKIDYKFDGSVKNYFANDAEII